jgi:hypothetical protein
MVVGSVSLILILTKLLLLCNLMKIQEYNMGGMEPFREAIVSVSVTSYLTGYSCIQLLMSPIYYLNMSGNNFIDIPGK